MMITKKIRNLAIAFGLCLALPLAGCAGIGDGTALRNDRNQGNNGLMGGNLQGNRIDGQRMGSGGVNQGIGGLGQGNDLGQNDMGQSNFNRQKAEKIRDQVSAMRECKDVSVVVMGDTALVGYTPSNVSRTESTIGNTACNRTGNTISGNSTGGVGNTVNKLFGVGNTTDKTRTGNTVSGDKALDDAVRAKVKNVDSAIDNVVCTQNEDFVDRISRMSNNITNNTGVNDMVDEFNQMVQRIMPGR